jgi:hypothetical protein
MQPHRQTTKIDTEDRPLYQALSISSTRPISHAFTLHQARYPQDGAAILTPFDIDKNTKRYGCYIEIYSVPHQTSWTGDWGIFDFTDTSQLLDFQLVPLQLTTEMSDVSKSFDPLPLAFGSHASVRLA